MLKSFKFRIKPSKEQCVLIDKHIGCCRLIYNLALETREYAYSKGIKLGKYELMSQLPDLKKEFGWLKEVNSQALQGPILHLDNAFIKFFKGEADFPKFKSKKEYGSFTAYQHVKVIGDRIIIPKFKEGIKTIIHRDINGIIRQATISKTSTKKYFISLLCETQENIPLKKQIDIKTCVGIDLGIKDFAITSEGEVFENPKFLRKAQSKLRYLHRKYSKHKGKRTKQKLALLHEKIANQRKDFLHKVSTKLIRENQTIALEDLNIKGMIKNHNLAQSISDASWSMFVDMLSYKAEWNGINIIKIGRFEPSSKTCCNCGFINKELSLKDRKWICLSCNIQHDRDVNAAINIKKFALNKYLSEDIG